MISCSWADEQEIHCSAIVHTVCDAALFYCCELEKKSVCKWLLSFPCQDLFFSLACNVEVADWEV